MLLIMTESINEKGYILLEAVIISFLLLALVYSMYYLRIDIINRMNCEAGINANYIAEYYLDKIVYLNKVNSDFSVNAGGINYNVKETVKNIDAYDNYSPNSLAEVTVSWQINKEKRYVKLQRRWHR